MISGTTATHEGAEDTLGEYSGAALLTKLFGVEPIYEYQEHSLILDFYDNWNEYCGGQLANYISEIRLVAKPGAFKNILDIMIIDCRESISRYLSGQFKPDNPHRRLNTVNNISVRLQQLVKGGAVESEWCGRTIGEPPCTGRVYLRNNDKPDLPSLD